jgi:hypothetical protein
LIQVSAGLCLIVGTGDIQQVLSKSTAQAMKQGLKKTEATCQQQYYSPAERHLATAEPRGSHKLLSQGLPTHSP